MQSVNYSYSVLKSLWKLNPTQPIRTFIKSSLKPTIIQKPGKVSPIQNVPKHINKPPYVDDPNYFTNFRQDNIEIKTAEQIQGLKVACRLARDILNFAADNLEVGMTTDDIDIIVHSKCVASNCYPSPLLYRGFPKSVCTSVNNVACHGIPDDRPLQNGDLINVDVTVYYYGFHGDVSETYVIGETDDIGYYLVESGRQCLYSGIAGCRPGAKFSDIGKHISQEAEKRYVSVVPRFCGHGIGEYFHGLPNIIHIESEDDDNLVMEEGMSFTIEPIISEGNDKVDILPDGWTAVTQDKARTVQFEHTVLVTSDGVEILTA